MTCEFDITSTFRKEWSPVYVVSMWFNCSGKQYGGKGSSKPDEFWLCCRWENRKLINQPGFETVDECSRIYKKVDQFQFVKKYE